MKRRICRQFLPLTVFLFGCGAPGVPVAPAPIVANPVTDLSAEQQGEGVKLIFTPPTRAITGDRLKEAPAVEIVRGSLRADGSPNLATFRVVNTIPGTLVPDHMLNGHVVFVDPLSPESAALNSAFAYVVRTRASQKRASADSNSVVIHLVAVPERISAIDLRLSKTAIDLTWNPPVHTSTGAPLNAALRYEIFRIERTSDAQPPPSTLAAPLASTDSTTYQDRSFRFGATYCYTVRSIVAAEGKQISASESPAACVSAKDTFPPAAPTDLVATVLPATANQAISVDLSWAISEEPELAGYRIYRSDQQDARGTLLNQTLTLSPTYRDFSASPAHHYFYTVTAVDRAGNESTPSTQISVEVSTPPN